MVELWVSRPEVVSVLQYNGENIDKVKEFVGENNVYPVYKEIIFSIKTIEGTMAITEGDYIIKTDRGILAPIQPGLFNTLYKKYIMSIDLNEEGIRMNKYLNQSFTFDFNGEIRKAKCIDIEFDGGLGPLFLMETKLGNRFWLTRSEMKDHEVGKSDEKNLVPFGEN